MGVVHGGGGFIRSSHVALIYSPKPRIYFIHYAFPIMSSTRGKKRSPPETQKRNVNPRVDETREVTIASGHQKGQIKKHKFKHTPGGRNLA